MAELLSQIISGEYIEVLGKVKEPFADLIFADLCFAHPGHWHSNGTTEHANDNFWVDGDFHMKSQADRWDANDGR
jgi:hypothetical protein